MKKLFSSIKTFKQKVGKWFWVIAVILLIVVWRIVASSNKTTKVQVTRVNRGDLVESVSTSGTVNAEQYSQLTFPSGGLIKWVGVKVGQVVSKGQAIAQLDTVSLNAAYEQASNNRRNTQANVDNIHDELKNNDSTETFAQKSVRTTAEAANDSAWDALQAAADNLRNASLYAPFAGVIDTVIPSSPGVEVLPGAANYTIVNPNSVYFDAGVEETDLPKVSVGESVNIVLDAYPNETFMGKVANIGLVAFTSSTGGNAYHVRISLPVNTNLKFRVGMQGDVDIIYNTVSNILKVSSSAVVTDNNQNYVWEIVNGKSKKVSVEVGAESDTETQITSGLSEDQEAIDNPPPGFTEGQKVSI